MIAGLAESINGIGNPSGVAGEMIEHIHSILGELEKMSNKVGDLPQERRDNVHLGICRVADECVKLSKDMCGIDPVEVF